MKVLITGASGQLGRCLSDRAALNGLEHRAISREQLDISDELAVQQQIVEFKPDIVINAAAYTAVDKAESEPEVAFAVNELGPKNLARACRLHEIPLIHISTDYVFNGETQQAYTVGSETDPQSVYGKSKLAGETAVKSELDKHLIIRTSWVFSEYGNNFVKTMLKLGQQRDQLGIVADQYGVPCYAGDLADCIYQCVEQIKAGKESWGTYHFRSGEAVNWYEFATRIFKLGVSAKILIKSPEVKAISTAEFPTPAKRPTYSVLSGSELENDWQYQPADWKQSLQLVINRLANSE